MMPQKCLSQDLVQQHYGWHIPMSPAVTVLPETRAPLSSGCSHSLYISPYMSPPQAGSHKISAG